MTKALIGIGDIHLRSKNYYKAGLKAFLDWFSKTFPDERREETEIVIAGDVLNKVAMLPFVAASTVNLFETLHKKAKNVYVILGNHDYGMSKYKVINTKDFLEKEGAIVIDTLCEYTTELGFKLLCLPWMYGTTHRQVNAFIESLDPNTEYDVCTAHWELESLFNSDFVDLSKVNAKSFMCGHIHQHGVNSKYLGSILPNAIVEDKEKDPSVVKMLLKNDENGKFKEQVIAIPSFLKLKSVKIENLTDISNLEKAENCFYKILHTRLLNEKDIKSQAKLSGVNIYSCERVEEEKAVGDIDLSNSLENVKEYTTQSHIEILEKYKDKLQLAADVYSICLQAVRDVA